MRLCTTRLPSARTWTVELRPHPQGPLLICAHCTLETQTLQGRTARSAALAHLARHARHSLLPQHLRTCQCHERGCRWHPRHRGCDGPLLLVLSREHGGRLWRLADVCLACARAVPDASVIPETTLSSAATASPGVRRRRSGSGHNGSERILVCDMLSYLATSLPQGLGADARVLALQCALRSTPSGVVLVPSGLMRGMALPRLGPAWGELVAAGWLRLTRPGAGRLTDPLYGAPSRRRRAQAADWALRIFQQRGTRQLAPEGRLVALAITAHTPPDNTFGVADSAQLAHRCGLTSAKLFTVMQLLLEHQVLQAWTLTRETGDMNWITTTANAERACPGQQP